MKILVTGANGFLGYHLAKILLEKNYPVLATGRGECRLPFEGDKNFQYTPMDFTDPFVIHDVFEKYRPTIVVHAGAMSKPDECELNQSLAYATNVEATIQLLLNAEERQSFFIFISTDFIFDGNRGMYREEDPPDPVNYYGRTKWEAEEAVREYEHEWAIVRTILLYGPRAGKNLLNIVREKLNNGEEYAVVDDQWRTPTYIADLAAAILAIIEKKAKGVFHISGADLLTPYEMARKTVDLLGLNASLLKRVTANSFSQPAKRPPRTGFIIDKAKKELGYQPVTFEEGLRRTFPDANC